jgi:hypothetical protein
MAAGQEHISARNVNRTPDLPAGRNGQLTAEGEQIAGDDQELVVPLAKQEGCRGQRVMGQDAWLHAGVEPAQVNPNRWCDVGASDARQEG